LEAYSSGGSKWVLDSGCTNHMTREKKMFIAFELNENASDNIVFANGSEGKVLGLGKIAISTDRSISNVF
jgi:hypothetical protein